MCRVYKLLFFIATSALSFIAISQGTIIEEIVSTYNNNQARFHQLYRGKYLKGTASVEAIRTDIFGRGNIFFIDLISENSTLTCSTTDINLASRLNKGTKVDFQGKIRDVSFNDLKLEDCLFVNLRYLDSNNIAQDKRQGSRSKPILNTNNITIRNDLSIIIGKFFNSNNWTAILQFDINNDGVLDVITLGPPDWCGASGLCTHVAFISKNASFKHHDIGEVYGLEYEPKTRTIKVSAHGSACNLHGSQVCEFKLYWDGNKFIRN